MPPIDELTRIEPVLLARLDRMGIFTTGLLLEVSETPTRRQTLADQMATDTTEVLTWRDEALMLNLASFGPDEHQLFIQARIEGLRDLLALSREQLHDREVRAEIGNAPSLAYRAHGHHKSTELVRVARRSRDDQRRHVTIHPVCP